ncbi:beta strand repeat-containing protein [Aeromicrobium terrae]|uniref:Uncharacterized protein n=1 Tax=Aeromicrobium terrae TaxID=2498846 RepID=A0A5C8NLY4_9ACTN|nr:putative Ig domain-containing protein [Aeromicrobium terrae]TXL62156.1 hypothetical protein FHP06_05485 [Aeromicrobium terrae]
MSARHSLRRPLVAATAILGTIAGTLAFAAPAHAAGPWFVATNGSNAANCLSSGTPCATIQGAVNKGGFVSGDTINVAPGTYTGITTFAAKGANVVATGTGVILDGNAAGSTIAVTGAVAVKLTGLTIRNGLNNSAFGGGIRVGVAGASVTTTDVRITANKSTLGAGAVVYAGGSLTMTGGSVDHNTNATSGGGILSAGTTKLTDVDVTDNTAVSGAGVAVASNASPAAAANLTVDGGSISRNTATANTTATGWGGGVYVGGKTATAPAAIASLKNVDIDDNVAAGSAQAFAGLGGGLFSTGTLTVDNASFSGNRATGTGTVAAYGGAIYYGGPAPAVPTLDIKNSSIKGGGATSNAVVGGAMVAASAFTATNLSVTDNVADFGGGIVTNAPSSTLTGGVISGNDTTNASAGYGGGIWAARPSATTTGTLTLDGTTVKDNTSAAFGGGLSLGFGVTSELKGGTEVSGNEAVVGGGIFNSGALTVRGSDVSDNDASYQGGGLFNGSTESTDTPSANLVDSTIDDNSAAFGGGGIVTIEHATLTGSGGHVNGNDGLGGGGVLVGDKAPATFDDTDFIGNVASNLGGGAVLSSGTTSISRATMRDNQAVHTTGTTGLGAAIYSGSDTDNANTVLTVKKSTISGNEAYAASAILTASTGTGATNKASIDNSTITNNTSSSPVGAIQQFHPMTITNSTITNNTAAGSGAGGGLYLFDASHVGVAGTILSGNTGLECTGGAVSDGGRNLSDPGDASCGFSGAKNDIAAAPQLGNLVDNGGPTFTRKPGPASPALDKIPAATATGLSDAVTGSAVTLCNGTDQRTVARPQGAKCDIGAVEVSQETPTVNGPASADYTLNSAGAPVTFTTTGTPQPTLNYTGTLPAGVTFVDNGDGTATLSGTPTAGPGGVYTITVKATNEAGTGTKSFDLVLHQAPTLSGPSASTYTVGQAGGPDLFEQTGGFPAALLSTTSTLPGGVNFTPKPDGKGEIAGTPDAGTGGVYAITIKGDNGTPPVATWPFTLTVNETAGISGPASSTFKVGTAGSSASFVGSGYPPPTLSATGLPDGLTLSGTGTAKITGTPADGTGGEYDATVKADNGIGSAATTSTHIRVNEAPELVGPSIARLVVGTNGTVAYSADGYPQASLSASGTLPSGVTFHDNGNGTAQLSGTPGASAEGHYAITIKASNGVDPDSIIHLDLEIAPELGISSTSLPNGAYHTAYSATINAVGGFPPYTFTLVGGSLPAGLTLHSDGTITGTPTSNPTTKVFTVKVTDAADPSHSKVKQLSITTTKGATNLDVEPIAVAVKAQPGLFSLGLKVGTIDAVLTGGAPREPIANATVVFRANTQIVCIGRSDSQGRIHCKMSAFNTLKAIARGLVVGTYAGNTVWASTTGSARLL